MRTLILYLDENGQSHCGCIIHDGSFDPTSTADVEWRSQLTGFDADDDIGFFAIEGVTDDQSDLLTISDEFGAEIGKQYIQR